jgi:hypothetical protein
VDASEIRFWTEYNRDIEERLMNAVCICIIDEENMDKDFYHITYCPYRKKLEYLNGRTERD